MNEKILLLIIALLGVLCIPWSSLAAQDYVDNPGRYQFAQTYVGADFLYFPLLDGANTLFTNATTAYDIPHSFSPRLAIGGYTSGDTPTFT